MAWGWSDVFKAYDKSGKRVLAGEVYGRIFSDDSGCYRIIYSKEFIEYNERILPYDPRIVYIGASKGGESSSIIRRASDYLRDFERMYHHDSPGFILKQHFGFDFDSIYVQFKKLDSDKAMYFEDEQICKFISKNGDWPISHKLNDLNIPIRQSIKYGEALHNLSKLSNPVEINLEGRLT
tara:strand:+ start:2164 stop:2703 length:540 start_codon:yes stop_codon:yes gene_type:complete